MTLNKNMRHRIFYSYLVVMLVALLGASTTAQSNTAVKVALIADKASGLYKSPLVAVLEARLSKEPNLILLERAEIEKILKEKMLQLTFEAEGSNARRQLGNMLGADVLLFAEKVSVPERTSIRLRMVETRTGIILDDLLQASSDVDHDVESLVASIRPGLLKVGTPIKDRRYIGIMDIEIEKHEGIKKNRQDMEAKSKSKGVLRR